MDPFQAKSVTHLAHARRETKKILLKLRRDSDGVIEDLDKSVEDKKTALTEIIASIKPMVDAASIKPMVEAVEHTSNSKVQALLLLDDFKETALGNLEMFDTALKNDEEGVKSKTRMKYGNGLLESVLTPNWNIIPSTLDLVDPLSLSDAIQVQDSILNATKNNVTELESRMRYLEQRVSTQPKIVLMKIFSDNENVIKLRKKNDPAWASKPVKKLDKELRKILEENDIEHPGCWWN